MEFFQTPSSIKSSRLETTIWVSKFVLMSMGIISILVLLKVAIIPYTLNLILSTLPSLWFSARRWLTLPFLYIIVNFIIITIAASSNFPQKTNNQTPLSDPKHTTIEPENQTIEHHEEEKEVEEKIEEEEVKGGVKVKDFDEEEDKGVVKVEDFNLFCDKFITEPLEEKCSNDYFLQDSDENGDDTLEATWSAIMEGQGKMKKPQLKKSDTWGARIAKAEPFCNNGNGTEGGDDEDPVAWAQRELKKSETFNDRASLRREKSMSQEELNRRAEDFIKKIYNQIKLQRLESYQRFKEMVNRGV